MRMRWRMATLVQGRTLVSCWRVPGKTLRMQ
nr:MAG TPA: hypothetical protein [Caudoviricetes sp.]